MEVKAGPLYIKSVQDRTVTGVFSVFGNPDSAGDIVWPGAFTKTFQERGPARTLHLWQHDMSAPPVAVVKGLAEVPREALPPGALSDAPGALGGAEVTREYLDTPRGNEVLAAIKAGSPLQASFGFDPVKFDFADAQGEGGGTIRNVREIRLWETSDVLWGANDATRASKALWDWETLAQQLVARVAELKTGARHSAQDLKALNAIHSAVVSLGATNCKGSTEDEDTESADAKSRAANQTALTQMQQALMELELSFL